jgi:integrase
LERAPVGPAESCTTFTCPLRNRPGLSVFRGCPSERLLLSDLRHSAVTILLSIGVHPKVVQELLGHNQINMTMDIYSHVLPTTQNDAISKLNNTLQE